MTLIFKFKLERHIYLGLFLLGGLFFIPYAIKAQKSYFTPSGQYIIIYEGEKWSFAEVGDINSAYDPENKPHKEGLNFTNLSPEEQEQWVSYYDQLAYLEANNFVKYITLNFERESADKNVHIQNKLFINNYKKAARLLQLLKETLNKSVSDRTNDFYLLASEIDQWENSVVEPDPNSKVNMAEDTRENENRRLPDMSAQEVENSLTENNSKPTDTEVTTKESLSVEMDDQSLSEKIKNRDCQLIFNGFDKDLNSWRRETSSQRLFSYTHPKLIQNFRTKDFLSGEVSVLKSGGNYFLNLLITIASKDARRSYGTIKEGNMLRITFISGKHLFLYNTLESSGKLESYTGHTIYQCFYALNGDQVSDLKKGYLDKIGIMWTTGFEEYPIYEVDLFQNQISCIDDIQN